jgi:hypothetical protein
MLGGSSGVMLYIAFVDLLPDAAAAIGHPYTWLFVLSSTFHLSIYFIM